MLHSNITQRKSNKEELCSSDRALPSRHMDKTKHLKIAECLLYQKMQSRNYSEPSEHALSSWHMDKTKRQNIAECLLNQKMKSRNYSGCKKFHNVMALCPDQVCLSVSLFFFLKGNKLKLACSKVRLSYSLVIIYLLK